VAAATDHSPRRIIRMLFFVRETYPTFRPDVDVLFGRELLGRGHEIDLVMQAERDTETAGCHPWHGRTVWVGITDSRTSAWHRLRRQCLGLWHDFTVLRAARTQNYDAVQVRDKYIIAAIIAFVARRRGLRFFYWLSYPEPESHLERVRECTARYPIATFIRGVLFTWLLYRWILPRCDHAFVQSEQMRRDVAAHGISAEKLTPVPMGVAATDVRAPRIGVVSDSGSTVPTVELAYLGTLNAQRRLEVLVEMLALLRQGGAVVRLRFIGGGDNADDQPRLERRAADLGVRQHMEITGFLPREAALGLVQSADICLSPFFPTPVLRSTSPTKLVEYLAMGLPVVANDHPEQRRVLRESRAGVCVPWGAKYFARGVAWLAARGAAERLRMGENGRQWVLAHRTYSRIADELEGKYLELLSPPGRQRGAILG
jgi:glycosyltransferase involved in cell wall biosynthesis